MSCSLDRNPSHLLSIALASLLAIASGCPQNDDPPEPGGAGSSGGSDTGTTGSESSSEFETDTTTADGTSTGPEPPEVDLWACEVPTACPQLYYHLEPGEEGDLECPAQLIVSGNAGHFTARHNDGSVLDEDMWLLVEPEGTAIVQRRERECMFDDVDCDLASRPWTGHTAVQRCTLGATEGLVEACAAELPECQWHPWYDHLEDCVDIQAPTCDELAAMVGDG